MKNCLNCNNETINNYCSVCGQSNSTHRFSLKHFFLHDFVHGIFHLDKGFLFTLKELFTRPGHSIREYMQGKRREHFNYFTLLILIYAIGHFLARIPEVTYNEIMAQSLDAKGQVRVIRDYGKLAALVGIPFYALATYWVFLKSKQNYTEHLVLTMYFTSAIFLIHYIPVIFTFFTQDAGTLANVQRVVNSSEYVYYYWFLYQYFSAFNYSKTGLILRCLLAIFSIFVVALLLFIAMDVIGKKFLL